MDKQYKVIIEGTEGRGNQVFEMDTPEEIVEQFQKAQAHATQKIAEIDKENTALRERLAALEAAPAPNTNGGTNTSDFMNKFVTAPVDALKDGLSQIFGAPVDQVIEEFRRTQKVTSEISLQSTANQLIQAFPEIAGTSEQDQSYNGEQISKYMVQRGWEPTFENMEAATIVMKQHGKLKLAPTQDNEPLVPVPTTVSRPAAKASDSESEEHFLRTAPVEKVREYLEKKHAQARV